jgi:hypothetical protein
LIHATPSLEALGRLSYVLITSLVAARAVASLEIIEVDIYERHRRGIADRGWPSLALKHAPAQQAGQPIVKADGVKASLSSRKTGAPKEQKKHNSPQDRHESPLGSADQHHDGHTAADLQKSIKISFSG